MIVRPLPFTALLICVLFPTTIFAALSSEQRQMAKKGLLDQLGLTKEPELSAPSLPVPPHVWQLYDDMLDDIMQADYIRHFYPSVLLEENESLFLAYNLSLSVNATMESLQKATLKLRIHTKRHNGSVTVYSTSPNTQKPRLLDSSTIDPKRDWQWIDLDVTSVLLNHPDILELRLDLPLGTYLYDSPPHSVSALPFTKRQSASLILETEKNDPSRVRRKRSATRSGRRKGRKQHRLAAERNLCQKRDLFVDFEELNWQDWILAPKGYEASQCTGICPHPIPEHLNATNHAIIQSLLHSINSNIPPPCCVPTETSHLAILYMDIDNRIIIKNYPDMRVDACGCR